MSERWISRALSAISVCMIVFGIYFTIHSVTTGTILVCTRGACQTHEAQGVWLYVAALVRGGIWVFAGWIFLRWARTLR
jgi:hypothetical protein